MEGYENCSSTGKRMFATIGEAKNILTKPSMPVYVDGKRVKRRQNKRKETRTYFCTDCKHWHLTSKKHFNEKRRKRK